MKRTRARSAVRRRRWHTLHTVVAQHAVLAAVVQNFRLEIVGYYQLVARRRSSIKERVRDEIRRWHHHVGNSALTIRGLGRPHHDRCHLAGCRWGRRTRIVLQCLRLGLLLLLLLLLRRLGLLLQTRQEIRGRCEMERILWLAFWSESTNSRYNSTRILLDKMFTWFENVRLFFPLANGPSKGVRRAVRILLVCHYKVEKKNVSAMVPYMYF